MSCKMCRVYIDKDQCTMRKARMRNCFLEDPEATDPHGLLSGEVAGSATELAEAIEQLYAVGAACERCGWMPDDTLWCTETHKIQVKHLVALKQLVSE